MEVFDNAGVKRVAAQASEEFQGISSVDPRFQVFADLLKELSVTGSVGDIMGTWSDMLFFCIPINSPE
jgi:hypothetical protein